MEEHQYYSLTHLSCFPVCSVSFWILAYATIMSCLFMFFYSPQSIKDGTQSCIATALLSHSNHFNSHYIFLQDLDCVKLGHEGGSAERRKSCCTDPPALFSREEHKTSRVLPKTHPTTAKMRILSGKNVSNDWRIATSTAGKKQIIVHAAFPLESSFLVLNPRTLE